jgi:hypothetical protein
MDGTTVTIIISTAIMASAITASAIVDTMAIGVAMRAITSSADGHERGVPLQMRPRAGSTIARHQRFCRAINTNRSNR